MILVLSFCVLSLGLGGVRGQCPKSAGTTKNLRAMMIGRCENYQRILFPQNFCGDREKNCTLIADNFARGVFHKPPCNVNRSSLADFVDSAVHEVERDKALLWSDVYGFVNRFTYQGRKYFSLEDTLTGYLLDGTRFCGQTTEPGYNSDVCATFEDTTVCVENSEFTMWTEVSKKFAETITGHVHVMLNGTSGNAFSNDSIFATWELPQLQFPRVNQFTIFLAYSIGQPRRDHCDSPKLKELQARLTNQKIPWTCVENPPAVKLMLCELTPEHPDCALPALGVNAGSPITPALFLTFVVVNIKLILHLF